MYVRTESVHTYIAKTPKRTIYAILYDDKVVPVNLELLTKSIFENQSQLMNLKISNPWQIWIVFGTSYEKNFLESDFVNSSNLTSTTQVLPSCHGDHSASMALDILSSAIEKFQKL